MLINIPRFSGGIFWYDRLVTSPASGSRRGMRTPCAVFTFTNLHVSVGASGFDECTGHKPEKKRKHHSSWCFDMIRFGAYRQRRYIGRRGDGTCIQHNKCN